MQLVVYFVELVGTEDVVQAGEFVVAYHLKAIACKRIFSPALGKLQRGVSLRNLSSKGRHARLRGKVVVAGLLAFLLIVQVVHASGVAKCAYLCTCFN